MLVYTLEP